MLFKLLSKIKTIEKEVAMRIKNLITGLLLSTTIVTSTAFADDVKDAIKQGLAHYQQGDFSQATAQLNYAVSLIQQMKSESIVDIFPNPLDGWRADEAESQAAGAMMMGGGISANRSYYKGEASVDIELMVDSPMLSSFATMFSNPAMITMSGKKLIKIHGIPAMYEKDGTDHEIIFVVNNNALFTVRGSGTTRKVIESYAKAIKISQLN